MASGSPLSFVRAGLLLCLGIFLAYLLWLLLGLSPKEEAVQPELASGTAAEEPVAGEEARIQSLEFTRRKGTDAELQVQAEDMRAWKDGARRLESPVIRLPAREGEPSWTATAHRAFLRDSPPSVRLEGEAVLSSSDGARLETEVLHYDEAEGTVRTEGPVRISRNGSEVEGDGLVHWVGPGLTQITGRVRGALQAQPGGERGTFRAERLTYDERTAMAKLRGGVTAFLQDRRLDAEGLDVVLGPEGRVRTAVAGGGAVLGPKDGLGETLRGERIRFDMEGGQARSIEALGGAVLEMSPRGEGREPLKIDADRIVLGLGPDRSPNSLLALRPEGEPVVVRGMPGARGAVARGRSLQARLEGGEMKEAVLEQEVVLDRGGVEGYGRRADWTEEGDLVLTGEPGVRSPRGRAYGDRVVVGADGAARVEGRVHSVLDGRSPGAANKPGGTPLFPEDGGPVFVSAESLEITPDGDVLVYRGNPVQAKQGDSSLLAGRLELRPEEDRLEAVGSVRSRIRLSRKAAEETAGGILDPSRLVDGRSDRLVYREGEAVYEGGVELEQGPDRVLGERVVLTLAGGGEGGLRRLEAEGGAEAHLGSRHGWGDWLLYEAEEQRVRLRGDQVPARALDEKRDARASGHRLTVDLETGAIEVEAHPRGRTVSDFESAAGSGSVRQPAVPGS